MTTEEIVLTCISSTIGWDETDIELTDSLRDALYLDDLDLTNIALDLEEQLHVSIDQIDIDTCETVKDLIAIIENQLI